jgi:ketosteroid isomerase-like protein
MDARATIEDYYDALRAGRPLAPFFAGATDGDGAIVKFGISETLVGIESVAAGLRDQTATTADWTVQSEALRVTERGDTAWFSDQVALAWTVTDQGTRHEFETRWSGTLERREPSDAVAGHQESPRPWRFVGMHVSTADVL